MIAGPSLHWQFRRILAALLGAGLFSVGFATAAWGQAPQVDIRIPAEGSVVDDIVVLHVVRDPVPAAGSAVAKVGGRSFNLQPSQFCFGFKPNTDCLPTWEGRLDLSGLPSGPQAILVTATDPAGNSSSASRTVIHDWLRVASPRPQQRAIARPHLAIVASCADANPAGCSALSAFVGENIGSTRDLVASGVRELNTVVDLTAYQGRQMTLTLVATDSNGVAREKHISIAVEGSAGLQEEVLVPGTVSDADSGRILYHKPGSTLRGELVIRDRVSGGETVANVNTPMAATADASLTATGAAFTLGPLLPFFFGPNLLPLKSLEAGVVHDLGEAVFGSLRAEGRYFAWVVLGGSDSMTFLRDVVAGSTTTIATTTQGVIVPSDVAPNGAVLLEDLIAGTLSLRQVGGATRSIAPAAVSGLTDGDGVLFLRRDVGQLEGGRLMLDRGGAQQELSQAFAAPPGTSPSIGYGIVNGWVGYDKADGAGVRQVWRMDPAGVATQLTFGNEPSGFEAIGDDGSVIFRRPSGGAARRHFLAAATTVPVEIGSLGVLRFAGSSPIVHLDGTLFKVNTAALRPQPAALAFAAHDLGTTAPARTFTFTNTGSASVTPGPVTVTGDFAIASNDCGPVAPGATCTIGITFTPTATGERTGKLVIDGAGAQQVRPLAGFGAAHDRFSNISTRANVLNGDDVMIGGFVIPGSRPKRVAIVATGFSLSLHGISNPLGDPTLTLVRLSDQAVVASNDDWGTAPNKDELVAAKLAPAHPLEAAILADLPPGAYTAIVRGRDGGTGVSVIGIYEVGEPTIPLLNISTRARVQGGENVMIGGFSVTGSEYQTVAIVATGPSLSAFNVAGVLRNPKVTLVRSSDQAVIATNDDWQAGVNAGQLGALGLAPSDPREAALLVTLQPGLYTAIVEGADGGSGVAVIGMYRVK